MSAPPRRTSRGYERLSAMDAMFLEIEDANVPMHMGSVSLFEAGPVLTEGGGLDVERIFAAAEAQLHRTPRLRHKLATIPLFDRPVWIDDPSFKLQYHIRHTAVPYPGDERQLKRLVGRLLSQHLDRNKPLWETWLVEGVEGERFAIVTKLHHCITDGVGSAGASMLVGTRPDYEPGEPRPWNPQRPPPDARLVADEAIRRAAAPLSLLEATSEANEKGGREAPSLRDTLERAARGAWRAAQAGLRPVTETPLNVEIGPHRRFDWTRLPLAEVKRIGRAAGGTVNDVVLALVAGAVRRFLERRALDPAGVEFRVAVPVNVRTEADAGALGNRVSTLITPLPLDEADPWRRLERVVATTRELKGSGESQAVDLVGRLADWLPLGLLARVSQAGNRAVNMIVTNVPGPQLPVYMLGARMLESYPLVPLMTNEALNVALFSYDGTLFWGFNADWDAIPDLHDVVESVPMGFEALGKAVAAGAGAA
ncbi:MAG: wax ester/triacylglycerol synthase family O-acyltransferase [Myxococcota bacterium]